MPRRSTSRRRSASHPSSLSEKVRSSAQLSPSSPNTQGFMRESPLRKQGRPAARQSWGPAGQGAHIGGGRPWGLARGPLYTSDLLDAGRPAGGHPLFARLAVARPSGPETKVTGGA